MIRLRLNSLHFPLEEVANTEQKVPREWINDDGNFVLDDFVDYCLPLVQGEPERVQRGFFTHDLPN